VTQRAPGSSLSLQSSMIRSVLTSPAAMWLKRYLRKAVWTIRGRRITNPPLPTDVRSILFVCHGNICRSPFAEHVARSYLTQAGLGAGAVKVQSAGFRASSDGRCPPEAVAAARLHAVDLRDHQPLALTTELLSGFDIVMGMEPAHLAELRRLWPGCNDRIFLLPLFELPPSTADAFERCHFVDPFGKASAEFERCYQRIDAAARALVTALRQGATD